MTVVARSVFIPETGLFRREEECQVVEVVKEVPRL